MSPLLDSLYSLKNPSCPGPRWSLRAELAAPPTRVRTPQFGPGIALGAALVCRDPPLKLRWGPHYCGPQRCEECPAAPTLPRSLPRSTIGAERLSFRVRNGAGRFPFAMAAVTLWRYQSDSRPYLGNRTVDACIISPTSRNSSGEEKCEGQVLGLLVPVSSMHRCTSTSGLSTQSSTGGLTRSTLWESSS